MNFSSIKNASPIYFYFVSIAAFVLANIIRTASVGLYYALLIVGLVFFFLGLMRRIKK
jgi:MFS superfamily sulfate permease-like transporter